MKTALAILLGAACAALIACGGKAAMKSTGPAPPSAVGPESVQPGAEAGSPMPGERDPRIVELDRQITADLEKLQLARPVRPDDCLMRPCEPMSTAVKPRSVDDPTCVRGDSQTCQDSCTLSDSICDSAEKICRIAADLGGDAWANEKCASGNASCDASRTKCCGCA